MDGKSHAMRKLPAYKVVLVGPSHAGKTSIINRYVNNTWDPLTQTSTQGAFYRRRVQALNIDINLDIWDTAGQERFRALTPLFYRDAQGAIVVFDLTDANSLQVTRRWFTELHNARGTACSVIVVGNKNDLHDKRCEDVPDAQPYCEANSIDYFETSAKTGANVDAAFLCLVKKMISLKIPPAQPEMRLRKRAGTARFDEAPPVESKCC
jgi:small GTP-binding protein